LFVKAVVAEQALKMLHPLAKRFGASADHLYFWVGLHDYILCPGEFSYGKLPSGGWSMSEYNCKHLARLREDWEMNP
jgi:hypothetical protein